MSSITFRLIIFPHIDFQTLSDKAKLCLYNELKQILILSGSRRIFIDRIYLTDLLRRNADEYGGRSAIVFNEESISWRELWDRVLSATGFISDLLDNSRQRVIAIYAPNSLEYVISYLAVVHAGHIAMPLDITFKKMELEPIIESVRPAIILSQKSQSAIAGAKIIYIEDMLASDKQPPANLMRLAPEKQIATLFLSSGTTGNPKTIPNTHANILWDIKAISKPMGWSHRDTILITLHLSHRHGLVICLLSAIYHGNTVYLEARFNPQKTVEQLASGKITIYSAVPSIFESLVGFEPLKKFDFRGVRLFASSSSALPPFLREAFAERFGKQILDRYGTSETGSIAIKRPKEPEAFGDLLDEVKIRLETNGEVALQSPGLFPGYFRNPDATAKSMTSDGWWLTGDIGELRGGSLVLKGRAKERISKSGYSIYPQDIEWALRQHPQVKEVKVMGLHAPGAVNDRVTAFYVGGAAAEALNVFSRENLPRSWRPDEFIKLTVLPKGRTGKVLIGKLREMAEKG